MRIVVAIVLGVLLGGGVGYLLAPRAPNPWRRGSLEQQLRAKATDYYRASRQLDQLKMEQMYTPVRQLEEADKLKEQAAKTAKMESHATASDRHEQEESALSIKPEKLEVLLDGSWAVTAGKYTLYAFGKQIPSRLDPAVWVYSEGQWWIYSFTDAERLHYGNPPDIAMRYDPDK